MMIVENTYFYFMCGLIFISVSAILSQLIILRERQKELMYYLSAIPRPKVYTIFGVKITADWDGGLVLMFSFLIIGVLLCLGTSSLPS